MPHPLTTTLLAAAAIFVLVGAPLVAIIFASFATVLEIARFGVEGAEPIEKTEVLVRSGEEPPEQGRTTLLRG